MAYKSDDYTPQGKQRVILDAAWELLQGVPYRVTARWLFYQLLQAGYYAGKGDYKNKFLQLLSRARHCQYGPWRPDSLEDDRREAIVRGDGFETPGDWLEAISQRASCQLSHWYGQDYYLEVWFEAAAMKSQFEYYTRNVTLRPFFGMPSIPYKWDIAKSLENASAEYGLPVVVLYFGDLDPAGETIPVTSAADIAGWCDVPFEFVRAGLNPGDEVRYRIPENFEHPGAYQWEALNDATAGEVITSAMAPYVDFDVMAQFENDAKAMTLQFRERAAAWLGELAA